MVTPYLLIQSIFSKQTVVVSMGQNAPTVVSVKEIRSDRSTVYTNPSP